MHLLLSNGLSQLILTLAWKFVTKDEQEQDNEEIEKHREECEKHSVLDTGHLYARIKCQCEVHVRASRTWSTHF
jgi:hypothetical protein